MSHRNTPASFWERVDKTGECWNWNLSINKDGYGSAKYQGRTYHSHNLAYVLTHGPLPAGMEIHHSCRNRRCCNPDHFKLLTHTEHLTLHRLERQLTVCRQGHPWDDENKCINSKGYRYCRACNRASQRRYDAAHPRKSHSKKS